MPQFVMLLNITSPDKKFPSPRQLNHFPHPDITVHHMNVLDTGFQVTPDETANSLFNSMFM